MLNKKKQNNSGAQVDRVSFHDGYINIVKADGRQLLKNKFVEIPYGEQGLGVIRYYQARVSGEEIDIVIAIPNGVNVKQSDIIELFSYHNNFKSELYQISMIQKKDTQPESIYLTLKSKGIGYADKRENN